TSSRRSRLGPRGAQRRQRPTRPQRRVLAGGTAGGVRISNHGLRSGGSTLDHGAMRWRILWPRTTELVAVLWPRRLAFDRYLRDSVRTSSSPGCAGMPCMGADSRFVAVVVTSAAGGIRTHTSFRTMRFERIESAVPPPP